MYYNDKTVLFKAEDYGYKKLRIPCIITPEENIILAVFEGRYESSDWAEIDIVLFSSYDGGKTFESKVLVKSKNGQTINNPIFIDGKDGIIHFLYCVQYGINELSGGVFYCKSTDYGKTFSSPRNITEFTNPEYRNAFALGPTHGIMLSDGILCVPVWLVPKQAGSDVLSHHPAKLQLFMSENNGKSWFLTESVHEGDTYDPNEACVSELSDGKIFLNIRTDTEHCRCFSVFDRSNMSFTPIKRITRIKDPVCCGSMTSNGNIIYICGCEDESTRRNLTVRISKDNGENWVKFLTVEENEAGYSDISIDKNENFYVMYETDLQKTAVLKKYVI